ncbi:MAG: group 1 truncated hemoglobin [Deltaproteobacteria bacterium]|nr:group 1 truncated hemoglobin [Deltaproteobacteria bacterium]
MKSAELFDRIGGDALRAAITEFYRRVVADVMIGFMFAKSDRRRLVDREWELIAALLGAPNVTYAGRPMRTAHAGHLIFGGQFERRMQILRETLRDLAVDPDVQAAWIDHSLALRAQVTRDRGSECGDSPSAGLAIAVPPANPDAPIRLRRR